MYLGVQSLIAATRRQAPAHRRPTAATGRELRQGLVSNLANPKMAVFFTSLLPQFAESCRPRPRRMIDALTGTALVAFGLRLATVNREV